MSQQVMPTPDWHALFGEFYGGFDHPLNPALTVRDFPTAVELATATKFGGSKPGEDAHASPQEAGLFWKEFQSLQMSPQEYLELLKPMAQVSFRLLNRPPSMQEIKRAHHDWQGDPRKIRDHYANQPHPEFPDVTAGEHAAAMVKAQQYSMKHAGRRPYPFEAQEIHHLGLGADGIDRYYKGLGAGGGAAASGGATAAEGQG